MSQVNYMYVREIFIFLCRLCLLIPLDFASFFPYKYHHHCYYHHLISVWPFGVWKKIEAKIYQALFWGLNTPFILTTSIEISTIIPNL